MKNTPKPLKPGTPMVECDSPKRGYWLVRSSDKARFFISSNINTGVLTRVCDRVLKAPNWGYWIDFCHGPDVRGAWAWTNLDLSDRFDR